MWRYSMEPIWEKNALTRNHEYVTNLESVPKAFFLCEKLKEKEGLAKLGIKQLKHSRQ